MARGGRWGVPTLTPTGPRAVEMVQRADGLIVMAKDADKTLAQFFDDPPRDFAAFVRQCVKTIRALQRPGETFDDQQIAARFEIAKEIFVVLRGDMKWSVEKAIDHIPEYLPRHLLGGRNAWEPDAKMTLWAESKTAAIIPS